MSTALKSLNVDTRRYRTGVFLEKNLLSASFLARSPLSDMVSESFGKKLLTYRKNEFLFHENEPATGVYLIISGKVKIVKHENKPAQTILYLVKPGDILGIHAIVNGHNYTNTAVAMVNTHVCFIPGKEFLRLIKNNNDYKFVIMQLLCTRIDLIENQISSRYEKDATERFAELLVFLTNTYGLSDKKVLKIELTMEDLANLTGTSKGYLSKIIGEFSQKDIIVFKGRSIKILSKKELEKIANI
jgi:CRP/FNR family transcriptional regulator